MKTLLIGLLVLSYCIPMHESAAQVLNTTSRGTTFTINSGVAQFVPLTPTGAGSTFLFFGTSAANQRVVISYSAECAVYGSDNITQLEVHFIVDGVDLGNNLRLCSDFGDNRSHRAGTIASVVRTIPTAGIHSLRVRAQITDFSSGDAATLDDSVTVVMR